MNNPKLIRRCLRVFNIFLYVLLVCSVLATLLMLGGGGHANVPLEACYPMISFGIFIIVLIAVVSKIRKNLKPRENMDKAEK